ncbi:MAG: SDR family oxidoreductase [Ilumatobacter sp.]|uniref:SDR family oxidoreductase n=1 Tax=Ilumatobacter sp. TaxID=1967498 RepID=UPI00262A7DCE|nr:SDR family oxidoreductase [Ilumatobacter sp.]MDJ0770887.1 SDR family oxidoreductase [Ilumatobacter sp.]
MSDFSDMTFAERKAIVTGGASGIGKATALRLAELGADVVVSDIDEPGGAHVAEQIGGRFAMLDVGDPEAWDRVVAAFGPFDMAFLNAGIATNPGLPPAPGVPIADLTDEAYRRIMGVNVDGVVYGTRAVLAGMTDQGAGDIVVTASMAGLGPIAMDPVYGLTKHAVVGFVRSMAAALDQLPDGPDVCISAICPGFTDTNIIGDGAREFVAELGLEIMPADRVAQVVARTIAERPQGGQWVIWPGTEPRLYEWNPPIEV